MVPANVTSSLANISMVPANAVSRSQINQTSPWSQPINFKSCSQREVREVRVTVFWNECCGSALSSDYSLRNRKENLAHMMQGKQPLPPSLTVTYFITSPKHNSRRCQRKIFLFPFHHLLNSLYNGKAFLFVSFFFFFLNSKIEFLFTTLCVIVIC